MEEIRNVVWESYTQALIPMCYMKCGNPITKENFECSYIIPPEHEGPKNCFNLRPLCKDCHEKYKGQCLLECFIENSSLNKLISELQDAEQTVNKDLIDFVDAVDSGADSAAESAKGERQSKAIKPFEKTSHELLKRIYAIIGKTYNGRESINDNDLYEFVTFKSKPIGPCVLLKKEIYNKLLKSDLLYLYVMYCEKNLLTQKVRKSGKKTDFVDALIDFIK